MVLLVYLCNDLIQSMLTALIHYQPKYSLALAQLGYISLTYQLISSFLQPIIVFYTGTS